MAVSWKEGEREGGREGGREEEGKRGKRAGEMRKCSLLDTFARKNGGREGGREGGR
jgi:hypothetical protein